MRIALSLSGQPRTWRHTRESLMAYFAGHEVDVFLHTWDEDRAETAELLAAYAPVAHRVEARPSFAAEKRLLAEHYPYRPPLSTFDMHHSLSESLALVDAAAGYDLVVRARFDAMFDGQWSGEAPKAGEIIVPTGYPDPLGCNDQFALGRPKDMALYAGVCEWLREALPHVRGECFVPEAILRAFIEQVRGLRIAERPIAMRLCREAQAGQAFGALADDPLFHAAKHEAWEAFAAERFPDLLEQVDFAHEARTPLALGRALDAWIEARDEVQAFELLAAPWPRRLRAVDRFIAAEAGDLAEMDAESYEGVRLMCAMLLNRMPRDERLGPESFVVHALSANGLDMRRAADWRSDPRSDRASVLAALQRLGPLARAYAFAAPLEQAAVGVWRAA